MISIIICSRIQNIDKTLEENIKETINIPFEIIWIDNSHNSYNIFTAYNRGIEKAKYPYLCFIHEDIIFKTKNWGKLICNVFQSDEKIGLIGVIGTTIVFNNSLGWWEGPHVGKIIQSSKKPKIIPTNYKEENIPQISDAVACDGLFLALPKTIFKKISFDNNTYNGFHVYDRDICMQVINSGYTIKILNNLTIEHFSKGNLNNSLVESCYLFNEKWESCFPVISNEISQEDYNSFKNKYNKKILRSKLLLSSYEEIIAGKGWNIILQISNIYYKLKRALSF